MRGYLRQFVADHWHRLSQLDRRTDGDTDWNMIRQHYGTWVNEDGQDVVGMLQLALKLSPVTALH